MGKDADGRRQLCQDKHILNSEHMLQLNLHTRCDVWLCVFSLAHW